MSIRRAVPNLPAEDPAGCREFYEQVLGFEVAMDQGWIVTFVSPSNPTAQISVLRQDATAAVPADVSVEVDDVDAVHAAAVARGLEIVHPLTDESWGVRRFFVRGPGGVVVNVVSHHGGEGPAGG
ncbi:VOC family protein [Kitasatospora sp. NPDC050543]|uniref:VOC family protein n=1 Tax=Kitasatospora sp. NPDC050543 TaxID=3364054 RepID=UPI0037AAC275